MTKTKSQRGHPGPSKGGQVRMRPLNLVARFLLEIAGLVALGNWGYRMQDDAWRYLLAAAFPIAAAAVWGVFAVPGDPSRSGAAPVPVPGILRLGIELLFFAVAAFAMFTVGMQTLALVYGVAVVVHYIASLPRIRWLLYQ
jgi:hypothetical protein